MPTVSVVIPTYNAARYIEAAVDSVLGQTFRDVEILVVDDGSTDDTAAVLSRYGQPVRYRWQENRGVSAARNRGIQESSGRYVAFLDADDTWFPEKLDRQIAALEASGQHRACYSAHVICTEALTPLAVQRSVRRGSTLEDLLLRGNVVGNICTVLCDRSLFSIAGNFDVSLSQCADWDMWVRLATITEFLYLDEPLVTYRQHESNMSADPALLERDSTRVLQKGFELPSVPQRVRASRRNALARNYMVLAGSYFYAHRYPEFVRCAVRAVSLDAGQLRYLMAFPGRLAARWRNGGQPAGQWR
jgi:glycosyltransferase involved in cell wall biosynthesis